MKPFRSLINGKNPRRIKFFDSHISMLRETSQEAHSHISSVPDIQRINEQELTVVPDFYQPLKQERFTAWGCIINYPYGDKSILRKERGMWSYGLLWLRHRSGRQKRASCGRYYILSWCGCMSFGNWQNIFLHCPSLELDISFPLMYSYLWRALAFLGKRCCRTMV